MPGEPEVPTRTVNLTPSPSGTFRMFERFLSGVAAELESEPPDHNRRMAMVKQVTFVRDELNKWPSFLTNITWEDLEALAAKKMEE